MPSSNEDDYLSPLPTDRPPEPGLDELQRARRVCVQALLAAQDIERDAAAARRKATRLRKTYERLLLEYNGQERLPGT